MSEKMFSFRTDRFVVTAYIEPEECSPEDQFDFQEDIDAINSGEVEYFCTTVEVRDRLTGVVLGSDHLGGSAYNDPEEFFTAYRDRDPMNRNCSVMRAAKGGNVCICHYFPDMIRQACRDARDTL